ncbi:hypothetical protein KAONASHI_00480 [Serratia phage vB_SmaP-Kaonashi]|nr:hypothetical protein KAONASHI_00480 [Serratia phage vB_SmaP-Kaonashi]
MARTLLHLLANLLRQVRHLLIEVQVRVSQELVNPRSFHVGLSTLVRSFQPLSTILTEGVNLRLGLSLVVVLNHVQERLAVFVGCGHELVEVRALLNVAHAVFLRQSLRMFRTVVHVQLLRLSVKLIQLLCRTLYVSRGIRLITLAVTAVLTTIHTMLIALHLNSFRECSLCILRTAAHVVQHLCRGQAVSE